MDYIVKRLEREDNIDSIAEHEMVELHYLEQIRKGTLTRYLELHWQTGAVRSQAIDDPFAETYTYDFLVEEARQLRSFLKETFQWDYHPDIRGFSNKGEATQKLFGSLLDDIDL